MFSDVLEFFTGFSDILFHRDKTQSEPKFEDTFYMKETKPIKFIYRPKYLDEYIGQEKAKELVKLNLQKILNIKPVHCLISGIKGGGKTTLANIIANHLDFQLHYYIAGSFTFEALSDFLIANNKGNNPHILFLDEIHALDKKIGEFLYPILEDFIIGDEKTPIRPFIMIGATTEKSTLIKKFAPLVDRCGVDIVLEQYKSEDIKNILKQYNEQIHKLNVPDEVFDIISKNVRYTPRIAINTFDDYVVCKDVYKVLKAHRIIKNSLTDIDIKILQHLAEINKPVAQETLAIIGGIDKSDYKSLVEPFLLQEGYLSRTSRGRIITNKGLSLIKELT